MYFLWHFPAGRPGWPLATTVPCPARTFLRLTKKPATARPTLLIYDLRFTNYYCSATSHYNNNLMFFLLFTFDFDVFFELLVIDVGEVSSEVDAAAFPAHLG